jgi:hypothetical protein
MEGISNHHPSCAKMGKTPFCHSRAGGNPVLDLDEQTRLNHFSIEFSAIYTNRKLLSRGS